MGFTPAFCRRAGREQVRELQSLPITPAKFIHEFQYAFSNYKQLLPRRDHQFFGQKFFPPFRQRLQTSLRFMQVVQGAFKARHSERRVGLVTVPRDTRERSRQLSAIRQ